MIYAGTTLLDGEINNAIANNSPFSKTAKEVETPMFHRIEMYQRSVSYISRQGHTSTSLI